jgi:hypothetical protein
LDLLRKEGFYPFMVAQSRSRIEGKEAYTKHMLRLRPKTYKEDKEAGEIILINSHDGTSSYKMMAGIYRFVCQNGLIAGDTMAEHTILHKGKDAKYDILEAAYDITNNFEKSKIEIDKMKAIDLEPVEQEIFAESSLIIKYDENEAPISPQSLLTPNRWNDRKKDLWTTLNVIQENTIKGGQKGVSKTGRRMKTRPVSSIDNNVKLNKALWNLSMRMAELKN